ncbi:MAG: hypothetical protein ACT4P7_03005 [Gemmatimonadaceae bacterium]
MRKLLRSLLVAGLLCALNRSAVWAQAESGTPSLSAARVTGQIALGTVLTPVAFLGAGWVSDRMAERWGWSEERSSTVGYVSAYSATWLAASAGPALVGRDGKFAAALGGSLAGMGAAVVSARLGNLLWDADRRRCGVGCWTLGALTVALPSIGATLAYNASRK